MKRSYAVDLVLDHYPNLRLDYVDKWLRRVTFVSLPRRYMYCQVAKAACTTMKYVLRSVENFPPLRFFVGDEWKSRRDMFIHDRSNVPLPSLLDFDDKTQREILESPDFFRMTIVRNPYTRLLSAWKDRALLCQPAYAYLYLDIKGKLPEAEAKSLISFEEFVNYIAEKCDLSTCDPHWQRQVDRIFFKAVKFSHIGKMENLLDSLERFQQHLGRSEPLLINAKNVSGSERTRVFTEMLADKIYSLYREDFEAFGYDRNDWPKARSEGNHCQNGSLVPEKKFNDEIVERNLVIAHLYDERDRLQRRVQRAPSVRLWRLCKKFVNIASFRTLHLGTGSESCASGKV